MTFDVVVIQLLSSSVNKIFNPFLDVTLETATYSWPCEKTGWGRYIPTFCSDCPWLLFIVIANDTEIGNCLR